MNGRIRPVAILVCGEISTNPDGTENFFKMVNSGAILFYGEPKVQVVAISFVFEVLESGTANFEIKISGAPLERDVLLTIKDQAVNKGNPNEYSSGTAGNIPLKLRSAGVLSFSWRPLGGEWEEVRTMRVKEKALPAQFFGSATSVPASTISTATMSHSPVVNVYSDIPKRRP